MSAALAARWDSLRRDQFTSLTNLLISLATALIAFQSSSFLAPASGSVRSYDTTRLSVLLLACSVAFGVTCALARLWDYRLTARIVRGEIELRSRADRYGKWSWRLLVGQLVFFCLGTACTAVRLIL